MSGGPSAFTTIVSSLKYSEPIRQGVDIAKVFGSYWLRLLNPCTSPFGINNDCSYSNYTIFSHSKGPNALKSVNIFIKTFVIMRHKNVSTNRYQKLIHC